MNGLIEFIENYLDRRDTEYRKKRFSVNYRDVYDSSSGMWTLDKPYSIPTIDLDEEDLKYLYDKYFPFYSHLKAEQIAAMERDRLKEIERLKNKIDELKNQTNK